MKVEEFNHKVKNLYLLLMVGVFMSVVIELVIYRNLGILAMLFIGSCTLVDFVNLRDEFVRKK